MLRNLTLEQEVYRRDAIYRQPDWSYDTTLGRYRDATSGRFLSEKEALQLTQKSVLRAREEIQGLTTDMLQRITTLADWQRQVAQVIKEVHLAQYILGRGGIKNTTPADFLVVARTLKGEYAYLDQFARQLASGRISEPMLRARINLYLNKTVGSYWAGHREAQSRATTPGEMRRHL